MSLFWFLAAFSSMESTRAVWMRPGKMELTVTPSAATRLPALPRIVAVAGPIYVFVIISTSIHLVAKSIF